MMIGAVSPKALAKLIIPPVIQPGRAVGKTTLQIVCHLLAPKARLASLKEAGTDCNASIEAVITHGRAITDKVKMADKSEVLKEKKFTKTARPNMP